MSIHDKLTWDNVAEEFDLKIGPDGDIVRRCCVDEMLLTLLRRVKKKSMKVLDAGSGNGYFLNKLNRAGFEGAGLDISPKLLNIARKRCLCATFYEADLEDEATIPAMQWDSIVCSFVLDGLKDIKSSLSNLNRLITKGGYLLVNIPHPAFIEGDWLSDKSTKQYVADDNEGQWYTMYQCTKPVKYYRRPISQYINMLIESDFEIREIVEPEPSSCDKYFERTARKKPAYVFGIAAQRC